MNTILFEFFVNKAIGVLLLVLMIVAARPIILRHLNANVAYKLWMIIPLFLFIPTNFIESNIGSPVMVFFPDAELFLPNTKPLDPSSNISFTGMLMSLWLVGFVVSLGIYITRYQQLKKSFTSSDYSVANITTETAALNQLRSLEIVHSNLIQVPAVFGLFKSYLILPKNFVEHSKQQQSLIIIHELFHLSRQDHRINVMRHLFRCLFWFNPIIHWADRYVEADQEISCDLGVIQLTQQSNHLSISKKQYGEALLSEVGSNHKTSLVSQWNYQSLIKERIVMLKNISQKKWHSWVAAIFSIVAIWGTSSVIAQSPKESAQPITPTNIIAPQYPRKAVNKKLEGYVRFMFNVDSDGTPYDIVITESTPKNVFDYAAKKAFKQWEFKSNIGQKEMTYTMEFIMGSKNARTADREAIEKEIISIKKKLVESKQQTAEHTAKGNLEIAKKYELYAYQLAQLVNSLEEQLKY
ncbi:M56 family metallopeptidase [Aliikangiella sp. IMCC44359]|uniref:M56 family metallopeptidase n=1 Tax=Aliikangiella sp. IMCC44359 TaxID=3459125 RepID=UPI00403ABFF6